MKTLIKIFSLVVVIAMMLPLFQNVVIAQEGNNEAVILSEAKELRKSNEKHFYCSDGTIVAVQYDEDVHYLDQFGKWQDVDNTLIYDSIKRSYKNSNNPSFDVEFNNDRVVYLSGKDSNINWKTKVVSMNKNISETNIMSVTPIVNSSNEEPIGKKVSDKNALALSKITSNLKYSNGTDGITTSYYVSQNSVKEDVIISKNLGYVNFSTEYNCSEEASIIVNEDGSLDFINNNKEVIYKVDKPYLYDASGSVCNDVEVYVLTKGTKSIVTYIPNKEWYTDAQRSYPITFDPRVVNAIGYSTNLYTNAYSYGGNDVNNLGTSLSIGYIYTSTNCLPYEEHVYYKTVFKPLKYPTVNVDENQIIDISVVFNVSSVSGSGSFMYYPLSSDDNIIEGGTTFSPHNSSIGSVAFSSTTTSINMNLPVDDYFDYYYGNTRYGFVAMTEEATLSGTGTTAHISLYGTSNYTKIPKIMVTYTPKNIDNRYVFIENSDKYLALNDEGVGVQLRNKATSTIDNQSIIDSSNPTAIANPLMSIWLIKRHSNGAQMIVSAFDTTKVLCYDASGNLSLISESSVTATTNCFWNINYGNSVGISCTISGNTYMLYNNGTAAKVDIGLNGTTATTFWNVTDAFAIKGEIADNREYILYNPAIEKALNFSNINVSDVTLGEFDAKVEDNTYPNSAGYSVVTNSNNIQRVRLIKQGSEYYIQPYINGSYGTYYLNLTSDGSLTVSTISTNWTLEKQANGKYTISSNGKYIGCDSHQLPIAASENVFHTQWYVDCVSVFVEKCGQKQNTTCGAASSAMILRSLGCPITEESYITGIKNKYPNYSTPYEDYGFNRNYMNVVLKSTTSTPAANYDFSGNVSSLWASDNDEKYLYVISSSLSFGYPVNSIAKISGSTGTMTSDNVLPSQGHYLVTTGNYYDYNQNTYYSCTVDVNYKYVYSLSNKERIGFKNILESTSMLYYIEQRAGSNPLKIIANKYSFFN